MGSCRFSAAEIQSLEKNFRVPLAQTTISGCHPRLVDAALSSILEPAVVSCPDDSILSHPSGGFSFRLEVVPHVPPRGSAPIHGVGTSRHDSEATLVSATADISPLSDHQLFIQIHLYFCSTMALHYPRIFLH